jgi:hypothetical protein
MMRISLQLPRLVPTLGFVSDSAPRFPVGLGRPLEPLGRDDGQDQANLFLERLSPWLASGIAAARPITGRDGGLAIGPLGQAGRAIERIRSLVADDRLDQTPSIAERSRRQAEIDESLVELGRLAGSEVRLGGPQHFAIAGGSRDQITDVDVVRLSSRGELTVWGRVTRAAEAARMTIAGGAGAVATTSATIAVAGQRSRALVRIREGQSLADVAQGINDRSAATGVAAAVAGDNLSIYSLARGRDARLRVEQLPPAASSIQGLDPAKVAGFSVLSLPSGATESVAGTVVSAAQRATLRYIGAPGGLVAGDATFRITGPRGDVTISVVAGESLAGVAQRINAESSASAVIAAVDGDDLVIQSEAAGSGGSVRWELLAADYATSISPLDPAQIADLDVTTIEPGSEHTLTGQVTRTATQGELTLLGGAGGVVIDGATFELRGAMGARNVSIVAGESLADVAARINAESQFTGVAATVSGNNLVLRSAGVGSAATVDVELLALDHEISVSGVNGQQLTSFQVVSFTDGATRTLSGTVTQVATQAQLNFQGNFLGLAGTTATFRLTGSTGTAQVSVSALESLTTVANRINALTSTTGVTATRSGNQLIFRSTGVGSTAIVDIDVLSGTFNTTGGSGNGFAQGGNAAAVINGQAVTAIGNNFTLTDSVGTYSFTTVQGFTGSLSPITIVSTPGEFDVIGGNGNGSASGLDALAVVNGQNLTGTGNRFQVTSESSQFALEFAAGFTGSFDPISIVSSPIGFEVQGGDATGRAVGSDAVAVINGVQLSGQQSRFAFDAGQGSFAIEFVEGFAGSFGPLVVTAGDGRLTAHSGRFGETLRGRDAEATINGQLHVGRGSRFTVVEDQAELAVEFAAGFTGQFEPITVSSRVVVEAKDDLPQDPLIVTLGRIVDSLLPLASGGDLALGASSPVQAEHRTQRAARDLADLKVAAAISADPVATAEPDDLTRAALTAGLLRQLLRTDPYAALALFESGGRDSLQHRRLIADLLR